jgi:ABC-type dipeptide/oligopeptide/nickel transport system permease subunit
LRWRIYSALVSLRGVLIAVSIIAILSDILAVLCVNFVVDGLREALDPMILLASKA